MSVTPPPPRGSRPAGKRLWSSVAGSFELDAHELVLLREATRLVDVLDQLQGIVEHDGPLIPDRSGELRAHPALVEARQSRIVLARLLAVLRIPDVEDRRPQRRAGARGVYALPRRTA